MDLGNDEQRGERLSTNWKLCCFCQQKKHEKLTSPVEKKDGGKKLYDKIDQDIKNCIANDYRLPFHLTLKCLIADGYENISSSLTAKAAIYHKTCRDMVGEKTLNSYMKSRETFNVLEVEERNTTNWELCCFCQKPSKEKLVHPYLKTMYHKSYTKIQTDIDYCVEKKFPLPFNMSKNCFKTETHTEIKASLLHNKAVFHNKCRKTIYSMQVDRYVDQTEKRKIEETDSEARASRSPKKTRRSFDSSFNRKTVQCFYCLVCEDDPSNTEHICKAGDVSGRMKELAQKAQNWAVFSRLSTAFDNTASDISYHKSCYLQLYNDARSKERSTQNECEKESVLFDPLVIAELVAYIKYIYANFMLCQPNDVGKQF